MERSRDASLVVKPSIVDDRDLIGRSNTHILSDAEIELVNTRIHSGFKSDKLRKKWGTEVRYHKTTDRDELFLVQRTKNKKNKQEHENLNYSVIVDDYQNAYAVYARSNVSKERCSLSNTQKKYIKITRVNLVQSVADNVWYVVKCTGVYLTKDEKYNNDLIEKLNRSTANEGSLLQELGYFVGSFVRFSKESAGSKKYGSYKVYNIQRFFGCNTVLTIARNSIAKANAEKLHIALALQDIFYLLYKSAEKLRELHDKNIIHRDIKLENLVVGDFKVADGSREITLIDLGNAVKLKPGLLERHERYCGGSEQRLAPEICDARQLKKQGGMSIYSKKSDIYAFGQMAERLFFLFSDKANIKAYKFLECGNLLGNFLIKMQLYNKDERPSMHEVFLFFRMMFARVMNDEDTPQRYQWTLYWMEYRLKKFILIKEDEIANRSVWNVITRSFRVDKTREIELANRVLVEITEILASTYAGEAIHIRNRIEFLLGLYVKLLESDFDNDELFKKKINLTSLYLRDKMHALIKLMIRDSAEQVYEGRKSKTFFVVGSPPPPPVTEVDAKALLGLKEITEELEYFLGENKGVDLMTHEKKLFQACVILADRSVGSFSVGSFSSDSDNGSDETLVSQVQLRPIKALLSCYAKSLEKARHTMKSCGQFGLLLDDLKYVLSDLRDDIEVQVDVSMQLVDNLEELNARLNKKRPKV